MERTKSFKFHENAKNRHFNGVIIENREFYGLEDINDFFVLIREKNQISSYMSGYVCNLSVLADKDYAEDIYFMLDSVCAVLSDSFQFALTHTEYLREEKDNDKLFDSYLIVILDAYVQQQYRNKGYFTAMLKGIDRRYKKANITLLGISDFESNVLQVDNIRQLSTPSIERLYTNNSLRTNNKQFLLNQKIAKRREFIIDSSWSPSSTNDLHFGIRDYYKS